MNDHACKTVDPNAGWLAVVLVAFVAMGGCGKDAAASDQRAGEAENAEESAASAKSPKSDNKAAAATAVEVSVVRRQAFVRSLTSPGRFEPMRQVGLSAELPGKVVEVGPEEGAAVKKGDVLLRLDASLLKAQIGQADAAVAQADAALAMTDNDLKRAEQLFRAKVLDRASIEKARLGRKQAFAARSMAVAARKVAAVNLDRLTLRAPFAGIAIHRMVESGENVNPGQPLFTIADLSQVKLVVDVPERDVASLMLGSKVELQVPALKNAVLAGVISRIPEQADMKTRTFGVEIGVDNELANLRGGMFARATLELERLADQVVVPIDTVVDEPTATLSSVTSVVFIAEGGKAKRVVVEVGQVQGNQTVIRTGLKGGEQLIVLGHRRVVDGDRIRVVNSEPAAPSQP